MSNIQALSVDYRRLLNSIGRTWANYVEGEYKGIAERKKTIDGGEEIYPHIGEIRIIPGESKAIYLRNSGAEYTWEGGYGSAQKRKIKYRTIAGAWIGGRTYDRALDVSASVIDVVQKVMQAPEFAAFTVEGLRSNNDSIEAWRQEIISSEYKVPPSWNFATVEFLAVLSQPYNCIANDIDVCLDIC